MATRGSTTGKLASPAPAPATKPPARKPRKPKASTSAVLPGKDAVQALTGLERGAVAIPLLTGDQIDMGLRATSTPGVYLNGANIMVDGDGVMLDYADIKSKDQARFEKILGSPVDTPAKLLKAVALDPQLPLAVRVDSAKAAAPYFDRKKPIGIDGGEDGKAINLLITHRVQGMSKDELDQFERLLKMTNPAEIGGEDENAA